MAAGAGNKIQNTHSQQGTCLCAAPAWKDEQRRRPTPGPKISLPLPRAPGPPVPGGQRALNPSHHPTPNPGASSSVRGPGECRWHFHGHTRRSGENHSLLLSSRARLRTRASSNVQFLSSQFRLWSLCFSNCSREKGRICVAPASLAANQVPYLQPTVAHGHLLGCSSQSGTGRSQAHSGFGSHWQFTLQGLRDVVGVSWNHPDILLLRPSKAVSARGPEGL